MVRPGLKVAAAVLGSVALAGVVAPPAANASEPSVQVEVCNDTGRRMGVAIDGRNQHGQWTKMDSYGSVWSGGCALMGGWWWSIGHSVQIFYKPDASSQQPATTWCYLETSLRDGSTKTCRIR
jgi:hypothetical protein